MLQLDVQDGVCVVDTSKSAAHPHPNALFIFTDIPQKER